MEKSVVGDYDSSNNTVRINTIKISSKNKMKYITALFHEALHAKQQADGHRPFKGVSIDQAILLDKLNEAETKAWDTVLERTAIRLDLEFGDHKKTQSFMEMDLSQEDMQIAQLPPKQKRLAKQNRECDIALQKELKNCHGNVYAAQKKVVGQLIKKNMKSKTADPDWQLNYDRQAIKNMFWQMHYNELTRNGNPAKLNHILKDYAKEYSICVSDISNAGLSDHANYAIKQIHQAIDKQIPVSINTAASSLPTPHSEKMTRKAQEIFQKSTENYDGSQDDKLVRQFIHNQSISR